MSIPRKHHFLPEWYVRRWAQGGKVFEFRRVGPDRKLDTQVRSPGATGYVDHLYTVPNQEPKEAAAIETDFLQVIDDRGAKAIALAESNVAAGPYDKAGLVQFVLSLLHRTPDRINYLEKQLFHDLRQKPEFAGVDREFFREAALSVFTDLVTSRLMLQRLFTFNTFIVTIGDDGHDLITSDRPLLMSNGLDQPDSFVLLPIGPRKLLVLTQQQKLVDHLVSHSGKVLSAAINDAVVVQATNLIVGANERPFRFIDNRLGRASARRRTPVDPVIGLVPWKI